MINLNKIVCQGFLAKSAADYIGNQGDLTVDGVNPQIYYHDGVTPGGVPLILSDSPDFFGTLSVGTPLGSASAGDVNISGFYKVDAVIVAGGGTGTVTAVAGAATLNKQAGVITSQALSGASTYVLTLSNSMVIYKSVVLVTFISIASTTAWVTNIVCTGNGPTNGQVTFSIAFDTPFTGTFRMAYAVFN